MRPSSRDHRVVVMGGGISGCLVACLLADDGVPVLLVERHPDLMHGASRWNDGKIHLGYTFTAVPSMETPVLMQEGAAVLPILERVLGAPLPPEAFGRPVVYLVDEASMVEPETLWGRAQGVAERLRRSADDLPGLRDYAPDGPLLERLSPDEAYAPTRQGYIAAAWPTTEIHVSARVVAERLTAAVRARAISVLTGTVTSIEPDAAGWRIHVGGQGSIDTDVVVNCTWEWRAALDRSIQGTPGPVSIRYKRAMFATGAHGFAAVEPSTRIVGRYGDIATFGNGDAYLSWYPAGLAAPSDDGVPPPVPALDPGQMIEDTLAGLRLPRGMIEEQGATWEAQGGYVVAHGYGDIDRLDSPLHRRDRPDATELRPGCITVDTGKYTLGPLLADRAARLALARLG